MRSVTVSKTKSGEYYISILCQVEIEPPQHSGPTVGVDLGLKDFATLSTGEKIAHPKHLRQAERRLKRLQRALSRKKKGQPQSGESPLAPGSPAREDRPAAG